MHYVSLLNNYFTYPQGGNMLTGCTLDDYTIWIGNGTCDDIVVTENHLKCLPPREQPNQRSEGHIISDALQIVVSESYSSSVVNKH